jgi:hypothetical protein
MGYVAPERAPDRALDPTLLAEAPKLRCVKCGRKIKIVTLHWFGGQRMVNPSGKPAILGCGCMPVEAQMADHLLHLCRCGWAAWTPTIDVEPPKPGTPDYDDLPF